MKCSTSSTFQNLGFAKYYRSFWNWGCCLVRSLELGHQVLLDEKQFGRSLFHGEQSIPWTHISQLRKKILFLRCLPNGYLRDSCSSRYRILIAFLDSRTREGLGKFFLQGPGPLMFWPIWMEFTKRTEISERDKICFGLFYFLNWNEIWRPSQIK